MRRIAILCQDEAECRLLMLGLQTESLSPIRFSISAEFGAQWQTNACDLVLIATGNKPELNTVRHHSVVPIIIIAEGLSEQQQRQQLIDGATVVISRPYSIPLLAEQINALLRDGQEMPLAALTTFASGTLTLNSTKRTVQIGESKAIRLSQLEFRLLHMLMRQPEVVFSAEQLAERIWGYDLADSEMVRKLIYRLRNKIEPDPRNPTYLHSQPHIGYYFAHFETESKN